MKWLEERKRKKIRKRIAKQLRDRINKAQNKDDITAAFEMFNKEMYEVFGEAWWWTVSTTLPTRDERQKEYVR